MVRYRLLALVSIPMLLTLLALSAVTLYWTVSDAWNKVLASVEADLAVASNSILILQREQRQQLKAIVDSYDFQMQIRKKSRWYRSVGDAPCETIWCRLFIGLFGARH